MAMAHKAMGLPAPTSSCSHNKEADKKPAEKKATSVAAQLSSWEENALF